MFDGVHTRWAALSRARAWAHNSLQMNTLFSSRAGLEVASGGAFHRADWPLGKVTLDQEALTVGSLFTSYRLRFVDIDRISPALFFVEIHHHASGVPESVRVWGIFLFRRLREAIQRHQLMVEVTD